MQDTIIILFLVVVMFLWIGIAFCPYYLAVKEDNRTAKDYLITIAMIAGVIGLGLLLPVLYTGIFLVGLPYVLTTASTYTVILLTEKQHFIVSIILAIIVNMVVLYASLNIVNVQDYRDYVIENTK